MGGTHNCAIQAGMGIAVCWGRNNYGQATPPAAVNGVEGTATDIAAGRYHTLAVPEPAAWLVQLAALGVLGRLHHLRARSRRAESTRQSRCQ